MKAQDIRVWLGCGIGGVCGAVIAIFENTSAKRLPVKPFPECQTEPLQ